MDRSGSPTKITIAFLDSAGEITEKDGLSTEAPHEYLEGFLSRVVAQEIEVNRQGPPRALLLALRVDGGYAHGGEGLRRSGNHSVVLAEELRFDLLAELGLIRGHAR